MKAAGVSRLKEELEALPAQELCGLCMNMARFRTDNKELLTYLLFYRGNEEDYLQSVRKEIDTMFAEINTTHLFFIRKSVRKISRITNKYIRFSGNKRTETELRLHFCLRLNQSGIPLEKGSALGNLYAGQLQKIRKAISGLHEDLQYDYLKEMDHLEQGNG